MTRTDLGHAGPVPVAGVCAADAVHRSDSATPAYERPVLEDLGTFAELTRGSNPTSTDGIAAGSTL